MSSRTSKLSVLSWNINGLDDNFVDERAEAICLHSVLGATLQQVALDPACGRSAPSIMCFQEVTDRIWKAHFAPHLEKAGYTVATLPSTVRSYYEMVAVLWPWEVTDVYSLPMRDSLFGRELSVVTIGNGDKQVSVLTGHLDSGAEAGDSRISQVRQIDDLMKKLDSVFVGDTNLREHEWQKSGSKLADAWQASGADPDKKWTWLGDHGQHARYDRCWFHGDLALADFEIEGRDLAVSGMPASDHLALYAVFDV